MSTMGGRTAAMRSAVCLIILGLTGTLARSIQKDSQKTAWTLDESMSTSNAPKSAAWQSDYEVRYTDRTTGKVMIYNLKESKEFFDKSVLEKYNCTSYKVSHDGKYILMRYDDQKVYRHSYVSKYVIYSIKDKTYRVLANNEYLQHAEWSTAENDVIYIKQNDIYMSNINGQIQRISGSGIPDEVFNGLCDWTYEEEILEKATSLSASPDGQHLLYLSLDDREVKETQFMTYGEPGSMKDQYTKPVKIRYSKPGTSIPEYQVLLFSKKDNSTKLLGASWMEKERKWVYGLKWVTNSSFVLTYTNRVQNVTESDFCLVKEGTCTKVHVDRNPKGWAMYDGPFFSKKGDRYLVRVRQKVGDDEYFHIHLNSVDGSKKIALTNGTFMVRSIVSWDESSGYVYYKASEVGQPASDHLYAVSEDGKQKSFCITCQMKSPEGVACKYGSMTFNTNYDYGIGVCNGPTVSFVSVYEWKAPNMLKPVKMLDENKPLRTKLENKLQPQIKDMRVKVTENIEADVRLYLPPGIDTSGKTKYPLLIYVYGGPDNPQVKDNMGIDWSWYLTTNRSVIYGKIDGRGTGRKGTEMMYAMYRVFGTVEMDDQRTATKYLRDNLSFIDKNRIGIWGWSYGGYATAKVLEDDVDGVFKCGVSVAPVSDWIYYNSAYTERYMDRPDSNSGSYRKGSLLYNVENLRNKSFLLMHGTADDNVHYQHAMHLAKVLQRKNIIFDQQAYPDEDHGIGNVKKHVYYTIDRFFQKCFE